MSREILVTRNLTAYLHNWQQIIWAAVLYLSFKTHSLVTCFLLAAHVREGVKINPAAFRIHFRQHLTSSFNFSQLAVYSKLSNHQRLMQTGSTADNAGGYLHN